MRSKMPYRLQKSQINLGGGNNALHKGCNVNAVVVPDNRKSLEHQNTLKNYTTTGAAAYSLASSSK